MLSTKSSLVVRSTGLILFLLLTVIYLLRVRNDDEQLQLNDITLSDSRTTAASVAIHSADEYTKSTPGGFSAEGHSIGDHGLATVHSHEHGRSSHHLDDDEGDEKEFQPQRAKGGVMEKGEKARKYHTKVFGSPWGSGGQLGLKESELVAGQKKSYGMPVETPISTDAKEYFRGTGLAVKPDVKKATHKAPAQLGLRTAPETHSSIPETPSIFRPLVREPNSKALFQRP